MQFSDGHAVHCEYAAYHAGRFRDWLIRGPGKIDFCRMFVARRQLRSRVITSVFHHIPAPVPGRSRRRSLRSSIGLLSLAARHDDTLVATPIMINVDSDRPRQEGLLRSRRVCASRIQEAR